MSKEQIQGLRYLCLICFVFLTTNIALGIAAYYSHLMWLYLTVFAVALIVTAIELVSAPKMHDQGRIIKHDRD